MKAKSILAVAILSSLFAANAFAEVAPAPVVAHEAVTTAAHPAHEAETKTPVNAETHKNLPEALSVIEKAGAIKIIKEFPAANNMTGYLIRQTSNGQYAAVVAENGYVFVGAMLDKTGQNLLPEYLAKYAPATDYSPIVGEIEKAGGVVTWGKDGAPVAYVFVDPNCIFCHKALENAKPYVAAGRLQLKIVPVAFLKPSSEGRAAAILQAKDPVAALLTNENGFVEASEEGGITPVTPNEKTTEILKAHASSMQQAGFNGTPAFIYKVGGKWYGTMMTNDTLNNIIAGKQ